MSVHCPHSLKFSSEMAALIKVKFHLSIYETGVPGGGGGRGRESLFKLSRPLDQDGHHAHIWLKPLKNHFLQNQKANDPET